MGEISLSHKVPTFQHLLAKKKKKIVRQWVWPLSVSDDPQSEYEAQWMQGDERGGGRMCLPRRVI